MSNDTYKSVIKYLKGKEHLYTKCYNSLASKLTKIYLNI